MTAVHDSDEAVGSIASTSAADAHSLIRESLVWDNHGCMPLRPDDTSFLPQLARYRDAGVDVVSLNVGFDGLSPELPFRMIETFREWIEAHSEAYGLATGVAEIRRSRAEGRLAIVFDIEGATAVGEDLGRVERFYDLGVRWMLIAYNRNNLAGGGCQDDDHGLTGLGRDLVAEMERVGMGVCCSHTGEQTTLDVVEAATGPVILSHSNPASLRPHPRNVSDEVMRAIASTGGVIGINGIGIFLGENDIRTETLSRHIDHAVGIVGPEHVGISLDYVFDQRELEDYLAEKAALFPAEMGYDRDIRIVEPERFPQITTALLGCGFEPAEIAGILGGNWLRVATHVWR